MGRILFTKDICEPSLERQGQLWRRSKEKSSANTFEPANFFADKARQNEFVLDDQVAFGVNPIISLLIKFLG